MIKVGENLDIFSFYRFLKNNSNPAIEKTSLLGKTKKRDVALFENYF